MCVQSNRETTRISPSKEQNLSEEWKTRQSLLMRAKDPTDEEAWGEVTAWHHNLLGKS